VLVVYAVACPNGKKCTLMLRRRRINLVFSLTARSRVSKPSVSYWPFERSVA
jgi:hypothetical protein